ncbi:MAG: PAS domain-containing protein, partial [Chitinophagaceae bacterium]
MLPTTAFDNPELLRSVLDSAPYAAQVFRAQRDPNGRIVDFTWIFTNKVYNEQYGDAVGKSLLRENPGVQAEGLFAKFVEVTETGAPLNHEHYYNHEQIDGWLRQTLQKLDDGFILYSEDITARRKAEADLLGIKEQMARPAAEEALRAERANTERHLRDFTTILEEQVVLRTRELKESRDLLQAVVNTSPLGMVLLRAVPDEHNAVIDFEYTWANDVAVQMAGEPIIGRRMLQLYPHVRNAGLFDAFVDALTSGKVGDFEEYYSPKQSWLRWLFRRHENGLFVSVEDITPRRRAQQLKAVNERFEAAIHVSPNVLAILKTIRSPDGAILDFHFDWVSHSGAELVGRNVTGERMLAAFPHTRAIGLLGRFARTVETGEPSLFEHRYDGDGFHLWICWKAVRFEDGLFVSVENVTQRKEAEEKVRAQANFISRVTGIIPDTVTVTELPSKRTIYSNRQQKEAGAEGGRPQEASYQVHPEDAARLRHYYERVSKLPDGQVAQIDYRARYGNAGWRWLSARGSVFERNDLGHVTAMVNVVQDITAQRTAEEELRAEHYFME